MLDIGIVCLGQPDPSLSSLLSEAGADFVRYESSPRICHGPTNKIYFFNQIDPKQYDLVVLLDNDTYVMSDFTARLRIDSFSLKAADIDTVRSETLCRIAQTFGLSIPLFVKCTYNSKWVPFYANSGVLVVPASRATAFAHRWLHWSLLLSSQPNLFGLNAYAQREAGFIDQVAVSLLHFEGMLHPLRLLDEEMNYPLHLRRTLPSNVAIVHYHDMALLDSALEGR